MRIWFFVMVFNVFMACGASSVDSGQAEGEEPPPEGASEGEAGDTEEDGETREEGTEEGDGDTLGSGAGTEPAPPPKPATPPRTGPCAKYPVNCGADIALCGQKYLNCLVPEAGPPAETKTVVCKKEGLDTLTLIVNTWNAPAGQNKLLCDYWENTPQEEALWLFATRQKGVCEQEMMRKKGELEGQAYKCE